MCFFTVLLSFHRTTLLYLRRTYHKLYFLSCHRTSPLKAILNNDGCMVLSCHRTTFSTSCALARLRARNKNIPTELQTLRRVFYFTSIYNGAIASYALKAATVVRHRVSAVFRICKVVRTHLHITTVRIDCPVVRLFYGERLQLLVSVE